MKLPFMGM